MGAFSLRGRPDPPIAATEEKTLIGFLDFQRATLKLKCAGLDSNDLVKTIGASTITLGGLLAHLAHVEDGWFTEDFAGLPTPHTQEDAWMRGITWTPGELRDLWEAAVERSRAVVTEALSAGGLETISRDPHPPERPTSLRWILVHMIEEYARHNGHADLLRESIDGQKGE